MKTKEPRSENYQRGWNDAHHDVTVKGLWQSTNKVEEINPAPDYVEGYLASQDNLLEERAAARLNASDHPTAS